MKGKSGFLLQGKRQLNRGAACSALGFALYTLASGLGPAWAADSLALVFSAASLYVFVSVAAARRRDKEEVSYNLYWGQGAVTLLTCMCGVLTLRERLGL